MGFWDSVKAGFFGAAGVDYYSMKNNEELRGLRRELQAASNSGRHQEVLNYMQFLNGASGPAERLVMVDLPAALQGTDDDRVRWAVQARPIVDAVIGTLDSRPAPSDSTALVLTKYRMALRWYGMAADEWIESQGVPTDDARTYLVDATDDWERAIDYLEFVRYDLARD